MPPHRNQLAGQRRANHKRQRSPQPHPAVIHGDLFLPGGRQGVGERHQRREKQVKPGNHQHQPGPAFTKAEPHRKGQRQQGQQAQCADQMRGLFHPRRNQQAAQKARHQAGAQQNTDGVRREAFAFEPHAPERQENAIRKKVGEITEREPTR